MLSVVNKPFMLSVVMLSVVMLNVVAPLIAMIECVNGVTIFLCQWLSIGNILAPVT